MNHIRNIFSIIASQAGFQYLLGLSGRINTKPDKLCRPVRFTILTVLLFVSFSLSAQRFKRMEYFINTDPGIGKAISIPVNSNNSNIEVGVTVKEPVKDLPEGLHRMFVRALADDGTWSITQTRSFYRAKIRVRPNITQLEYFIDTDPGIGKASKVEVSPVAADIDKQISIIVDETANGMHTLYIRAKDLSGQWSITQQRTFYQFYQKVTPEINMIEYFIDTDPGFGKGSKLTPSGVNVNEKFSVDLTNTTPGMHTLYVRSRNTMMQWSLSQHITFVMADIDTESDVQQIEYFIDRDPGFGKAKQLTAFNPGRTVTTNFQVEVDALASGVHTLYIRSKNSAGHWGVSQTLDFMKLDPQTIADVDHLEYFIDTDPGFGKAHSITVTTPGDHVIQPFTVDLSQIVPGLHNLYVRARNTAGKWSITQSGSFMKVIPTTREPINALEWFIDTDPGFGNANPVAVSGIDVDKTFNVNFGSLDRGLHTLYVRARNAKGQWSITQAETVFRMTDPNMPDVIRLEYFITKYDDAGKLDPGFGKAVNVPVMAGKNIIQPFRVNLGGATEGWYTLNVRAMDSKMQWSITQQQNFLVTASMSEAVSVEYFIDTDPGFGKAKKVLLPSSGNKQVTISINSDEYTEGAHTLYVRALNQKGVWSITQYASFYSVVVKPLANISALEYFIDTDPGFGKATPVAVTPGTRVVKTFNVPLTAVDDGMHTLYIRARTTSGVWSITGSRTFQKILITARENLRRLEYFIDTDPGFGKATTVALSQNQEANKDFTVSLSGIPSGFHTLYVRSQNMANKWSVTQSTSFFVSDIPENYKIPDVTALEWFIDTDPGVGKSINRVLLTAGQNVQKTFTADISSVAPGMHTFYVRAINTAGKWSITQRQVFIKSDIPADHELPDIARLEYFIDTDPGFGKGVSVSVPSLPSTGAAFNVDISSIPDGPHTLYMRAIDKNGKWTITQHFSFYRTDIPINLDKAITYVEYFLDNDPGFGKGISIPITKGESVDQSLYIPMDDMWPGAHTLYIRAKDARGYWSIAQSTSIMVVDNPNLGGFPDIVGLEYFFDTDPGFGKAEYVAVENVGINATQKFFIEIEDIPEGIHTLYIRGKNSVNKWSQTHNISIFNTGIPQFEDLKSITAFEYFIDTDPGLGKAHYVAAAQPEQQVQQRITVNVDDLEPGYHSVYIRAQDNTGKWSHTQSYSFLRIEVRESSPVIALEWFIDTDPGFGKATEVPVAESTSLVRSFNASIPATLDDGLHALYVRACNKEGVWSITHSIDFSKITIHKVSGLAALEYFIDKDPGFGEATAMPVPYGDLNANSSVIVPLSADIEGLHTLYVRAMNMDNAWSITQTMDFTVLKARHDKKILAVEYFIDKDPGFGKATQVTITPATTIDKTFQVNLGAFEAGLHTLYVRARDESNNWSITQDISFLSIDEIKVPDIVEAEYFLNTDPGFGKGIDIPVTEGAQIQKTVQVNTSALDDGMHIVFVRVKDSNGAWSITQFQQFVKQSEHTAAKTTALEWFIDTDPGFGKANNVAPGSGTVNIPINTATLDAGIHTLYVRAKNNNNHWGITQDITFIKLEEKLTANIVAYEWFIDTDPGFGKAPGMTSVSPAAQLTKTVTVNLSAVSEGLHTVYVRVLDDQGAWSITQNRTFLKTVKPAQANLVAMEYFINTDIGFGKNTQIGISGTDATHAFVIDMTGIGEGLNTLYVRALDDKGQWSITQNIVFNLFKDDRDIADVEAMEWFIDTDPGFGNAPASQRFSYNPPRRTIIETFAVDVSSLSLGWHNFYARVKNTDGAWSITQYQPFVTIKSRDIVALEYFIDTDKGFGKNTDVPITSGTEVVTTFNVATSGLTDGMHILYVRALDKAGSWSITQSFTFMKVEVIEQANISRVEYFIDTDPGFGKAIAVGSPSGANVDMTFLVDLNAVSTGAHTLYVRSQDDKGAWSITHSIDFMNVSLEIIPDIARLEYFFDTDPGFGLATSVAVDPATHVIKTFAAQIPANMSQGLHTFYVRAVDKLGRWSHTQYNQFIKIEKRALPNVVAVEYFIDKDPGFGKALRKIVTPGTSVNQSINVNIDAVPEGMHTLYVRALDANGNWSITHNIDFMKVLVDVTPTDVAAIEWFIDEDPGFGKANPAPAFTAANTVQRTFAITLNGVADGAHMLYIRAMDSKENWSITQYEPFVKSTVRVHPKVVAIEYFMDTDPGFGKAKQIDINPAVNDYNTSIAITSSELTVPGFHTLYVRTLDNNKNWGITQTIDFIVFDMNVIETSKTMALEYFFDTDPGFGKGKRVNISPTALTADRSFIVSTSGLAEGMHTLYLRALNENQHWSITHSIMLAVVEPKFPQNLPDIARIEYFINDDPGFGKGEPIPVSPASSADKIFQVDVTGLTNRQHTLYIRAISKTGRWAITHTIEFETKDLPPVDPEEYPEGGTITPEMSEICQNRGTQIPLRAQGAKPQSRLKWEQRSINESGATSNWSPVLGTTNGQTLYNASPNIPGTWEYRLGVRGNDGRIEYSTIAVIIVKAAAEGGSVTANISEFICSGKDFTLTLEKYKGDIVKWQERNTSAGGIWTDINKTDEEITVTPSAGGAWEYRAEVAQGDCSNAFSQVAVVNVIDATTGGIVEPATLTSCVDKTFELTVKNYLGKVVMWEISTDNGNIWTPIIHTSDIYITSRNIIGRVHYRAVVKAGNCDNTYSEPAVVTVLEKIEAAGPIIGPDMVCAPELRVKYSLTAIPYVDGYEWTLPVGATFDGDNDKSEIWVNYATLAQSGSITVKGVSDLCGAGTASVLPIEVRQKPETPVVSGPQSICVGDQPTYSVPAIAGATYTWVLPVGWTGTSTSNTITVSPNGISGTISVMVTHPVTNCTSEIGTYDVIVSTGINTGPLYRLPNNF